MKKRQISLIKPQSGVALLALLVGLILAGSYAFYRNANLGFRRSQQDTMLTLRLAKAKEALIAYAVIDDKRPGRMPCPDLLGDGISPILKGNDCQGWDTDSPDVYIGHLPWKTLDVADTIEEDGISFGYAISRFFAGDRTGDKPEDKLNSETPTSLRFNLASGAASNDIVAVIIARRGALDTKNADGDAYFFSGSAEDTNSPAPPENNDRVAVITRQELMAAVEKRIAGEVKNCLEQHALSSPDYSYPWPAPLSNTLFKGQTKSLFGQVPDTQPAGNADELLQQINQDLKNAKATFATPLSASNADAKYKEILQLQQSIAYARALYDRLYLVATDLYSKSISLAENFDTLDKTLSTITANNAAFTASAAGIPAAIDLAQPSLNAFRESLANSGFDLFLVELKTENAKLISKIALAQANPDETNISSLQTQTNVFKSKLFANSVTPNAELSTLLSNGIELASTAVEAAKAAQTSLSDNTLTEAAINSALLLADANQTLDRTILAIRLGVDPMSIEVLNAKLAQALENYSAQQAVSELDALSLTLNSLQRKIQLVTQGANAVLSAKISALDSLASAIEAIKREASPAQIQSNSVTAAGNVDTLIRAMQSNGDNIAQTTLKAVGESLSSGKQTPPTSLAGGKYLRALAKLVSYWADNATTYSKTIAQKARKKPGAEEDSDGSVFIAAKRLLNSLDGESGTLELLKQSRNPGNPSAREKAQTALNKTEQLLNTLETTNTGLEGLLEAGQGDAVIPTKWQGSACSFLQPSTGSETWWTANNWHDYIFYQISNRFRADSSGKIYPGKLKVNGSDGYRVIAISAGEPLTGKTRSTRKVGDYLDSPINADTSRDMDAQNPSVMFSSEPVSPTFNDRLAY